MKFRTVLGVSALLLAVAIPATGLGQRNYGNRRSNERRVYGNRPSYNVGGYRNGNRGATGPIRIGGASVYFGPGGGNYGYFPPTVFYNSYPYPTYGSYGYGYPSYYGGYTTYGFRY